MKRAIVTLLAVFSLTLGIAGTFATVSDARSNHAQKAERGGGDHGRNRDCDDDQRSRRSTPKACNDDGDHDRGGGRGGHHDD
jgi:hypothetical protein